MILSFPFSVHYRVLQFVVQDLQKVKLIKAASNIGSEEDSDSLFSKSPQKKIIMKQVRTIILMDLFNRMPNCYEEHWNLFFNRMHNYCIQKKEHDVESDDEYGDIEKNMVRYFVYEHILVLVIPYKFKLNFQEGQVYWSQHCSHRLRQVLMNS